MLAVTDQTLVDVIKQIFEVKCVFGHEDRVAKQFYDVESNTLISDFAVLFRERVELNPEVRVGHLHGKIGFDIFKRKTDFSSLVWRYIPVIVSYELKFFLSSRFKMNDIIRAYYFWRYSPNIEISVSEIFKNFKLPSNFPAKFKISVLTENLSPEDVTDYYSGDDNLIFKLNCPINVETILLSPEIEPLIQHVNIHTTVYNREKNIENEEDVEVKK